MRFYWKYSPNRNAGDTYINRHFDRYNRWYFLNLTCNHNRKWEISKSSLAQNVLCRIWFTLIPTLKKGRKRVELSSSGNFNLIFFVIWMWYAVLILGIVDSMSNFTKCKYKKVMVCNWQKLNLSIIIWRWKLFKIKLNKIFLTFP